MSGDYYTPVDAKQAKTWKEASELPDFGLKYPPSIVFIRKEGEQGAAEQPATAGESK